MRHILNYYSLNVVTLSYSHFPTNKLLLKVKHEI